MKKALDEINPAEVDAIVMHAPGTIKGDSSEYNAIKEVFGDDMPQLTTNKWKIGHMFATSGMLNLELAILMLQNNEMVSIPYLNQKTHEKDLKKVLVNAVGFGGNAVSILVSKKE